MTSVAVTTTADRQLRVAGLMRAVGLQPVSLPCIEIVASDDSTLSEARNAAVHADAVVITSPRTVRLVWPESMPQTAVWAVGNATARAVTKAGGRVVHVGSAGAAALVASAPAARHMSVAFPHAAETPSAVIEHLASRIGALQHQIVYSTGLLSPAQTAVDAVAFLSPSAVHGWVSSRTLSGLLVAAIGRTTAAELETLGVAADVVPPHPDVVAMAHGIAAAAGDRIPSTPVTEES